MVATAELYQELVGHLRQTSLLGSCVNVLGWDEQTYLPTAGAEHRSNQLGLLAGMIHDRVTHPRVGELLGELGQRSDLGEPDSPPVVNVRESRRQYDRATKLPKALVEELSRVTSLGQQAWVKARKASDFAQFRPWLEKIVELKRQEARCIGFGSGAPYDALLDEYEPGMKVGDVQAVFTPLREALVKLVADIAAAPKKPDVMILHRRYPIEAQRVFATDVAQRIGFDFEAGRLDVTAHPFCNGIGPGDCRLTTRYNENHFPEAFFGVLHEAGHGMYEQGLDRAAYGTPMGDSVSLGIHESQSRMWENFVGRSLPFWRHFYPQAQAHFPDALGTVRLDEFYAAVNDVRPSLIRVEADEVTYNLHIMLRFELEQPLIAGDLQPADVPTVWTETFTRYFGIVPPDDRRGCLQDVHWSGGMIGYFPTYALGNMYAAQLYNAADRDLGGLDAQFARGEFQPLKEWLNTRIHQKGKQYRPQRLVEMVTGETLSPQPLIAQLKKKFGPLYGLPD